MTSAAYEDESLRQNIADLYNKYEGLIVSLLEQGEEAGEFKIEDKKTYSAYLSALGDGLVTRQILAEDLDLAKIRKELLVVIDRLLPEK